MYSLHELILALHPTFSVPEFSQFFTLKLYINFPYSENPASVAYILKHYSACIYKCEAVALDRLKQVCAL
jgi:hypothetical protein